MKQFFNNLKITALLSLLTGIFLAGGYILGGTGGMIVAFGLALVMNFVTYWFSDKIVVKIYGAEKADESLDWLQNDLEQLSENAEIPVPELYISTMKAPNAFATGRSPKKGVVCVTEGLLRELEREEVKGVVAHELAHIKNRDMLINSIVAVVAGSLAFLAEMAFWTSLFTDDDIGDIASAMVLIVLTPLIAGVIRMAISRQMEYRADTTGVQIHGQREGLSAALEKISSYSRRTPKNGHYSRVQEAGSNLFISNPFEKDRIASLFSTHPSLENRLENINSSEL